MTATETLTKPMIGTSQPLLRHIMVKKVGNQTWSDKCLCGHIWDAPFLSEGPMCKACLREYKRLTGKDWAYG